MSALDTWLAARYALDADAAGSGGSTTVTSAMGIPVVLPWTRRCCSSWETQGAAQFARHCRRGDRVRRWESAAGTKRQFAAAQRCGSYQRRTRRSAAALNPRRARPEERCHAAFLLKGLLRRNGILTGRPYPKACPPHDRVD